ncbi:histidinol-phosphate/aromatic aminotransferase/cobyric acid decarboxylase-like protein/choline kinase [Parabacteroides sp. PF5-5]|uniref:aminotransferase class I/II-fold pyridoxal phosphate-dependent enzyme n=1 Tax=unclassified Parabacteroides TaxID=2649774 RepID=UPI0024754289|nr:MULTISPECIES: aminotransferase class I/II-fold pyridoxal phosphate-dependent enzyme [unclassified Parabacteroides]MDH6306216.1 histidinol-phosphate/aromatic aminotransferase/cobyric acid decarboxylase-like protein/choline kinase [Parabacteroides sp. PH5-39]MDH6317175.1 histidinol-phosphate/aromatic aminotransferase/cobyric acid decarboxylase-like protein/choline kinase [Parabacteroides sp. PF5-13]MDH6320928.1 histidinol-phosphate/aromatic aminotransferase/cobyric acid decarboxylase-like prote
MQAIILAAGMGKRLGDLTKDNTKCMVKVHSQTLIERMLTQLTSENMRRIIIVIGYKGENVKKLIGDTFNGTPIFYVENKLYDKTNNIYSLYLAREYLMEDETILLESDLIFSKQIIKKLIRNPYPNLTVVAKYQSWMDGTVVTIDADNNIINFIPKKAFRFSEKEHYYKTVNIYKFSVDFSSNKYVPFLEAYSKALGNNEYYEQVLRVISLLDEPNLKAMPIADEKWYEIDDEQDLQNAEALFSSEEEAPHLYGRRFGGYWRFPQMTDFCYLVNPYFPNERMKEEMSSNFNILLTEYPSGMGVNSALAARFTGIYPEQIVVGNGAAELIHAYLHLNDLKTGLVYPTFEEYPNRLSASNKVVFHPANKNFSYSADDLITFFEGTDISQLVIINPDNPSGNLLSQDDVLKLVKWSGDKNLTFILDESFIDFADTDKRFSLFRKDFLSANPHVIVIKSISKSYGVPGLRLGFMASGNTELIGQIKKEVSIWNINSFAEFFMQIFIKYQDAYEQACLQFVRERERFRMLLSDISYLRIIPSAANYFLCEVTEKYSAKELCSQLLYADNILIKDCSNKVGFNSSQYIRIAIRDEKDNNMLKEALQRLDK